MRWMALSLSCSQIIYTCNTIVVHTRICLFMCIYVIFSALCFSPISVNIKKNKFNHQLAHNSAYEFEELSCRRKILAPFTMDERIFAILLQQKRFSLKKKKNLNEYQKLNNAHFTYSTSNHLNIHQIYIKLNEKKNFI